LFPAPPSSPLLRIPLLAVTHLPIPHSPPVRLSHISRLTPATSPLSALFQHPPTAAPPGPSRYPPTFEHVCSPNRRSYRHGHSRSLHPLRLSFPDRASFEYMCSPIITPQEPYSPLSPPCQSPLILFPPLRTASATLEQRLGSLYHPPFCVLCDRSLPYLRLSYPSSTHWNLSDRSLLDERRNRHSHHLSASCHTAQNHPSPSSADAQVLLMSLSPRRAILGLPLPLLTRPAYLPQVKVSFHLTYRPSPPLTFQPVTLHLYTSHLQTLTSPLQLLISYPESPPPSTRIPLPPFDPAPAPT